MPEDTDPTVALVYTELHWGRNSIMVTLRHRGAGGRDGTENVPRCRDGICHGAPFIHAAPSESSGKSVTSECAFNISQQGVVNVSRGDGSW